MSSLSNVQHKDRTFGFPPPRFLRMPGAGINISDHSIKAVAFEDADSMLKPKYIAEHTIENDVVDEGEVQEPGEVIETLTQMREELGLRFVYLSIPEEQGYIFGTEIPHVAPKEIHDTIEVRLSEHVPLSPKEAVFGCDVVQSSVTSESMYVNVSVLPRRVVGQYLDICTAADLIPLVFEIEAQSIRRAVMRPDDLSASMIVDIGRTRTGLSIVNRGVVRYTATLDMGGDMLTQAVAKQLDLSFKEADKTKQERGFVRADVDSDLHLSLVNCVSALVDEIQRRFDYWDTHSHESAAAPNDIERIILCGGNASIPGLSEHIARSVGVPVELANVWQNAFSTDEYIPEIDLNHSLQYASAIGLALNNH